MQNKIIVSVLVLIWLFSWFTLIFNSQDNVDKELQKLYMQQAQNMTKQIDHKKQKEYHEEKYNETIKINEEIRKNIQTYVNADETTQELVFIEDR